VLPNDNQSANKRRKVGIACKLCRVKKTRCGGQRPSCPQCVTKGIECQYDELSVSVSSSGWSDLETRLQKLEGTVSRHWRRRDSIEMTTNGDERRRSPGSQPAVSYLDSSEAISGQDGTPYAGSSIAEFVRDITIMTGDSAERRPARKATSSLGAVDAQNQIEMDEMSMVVPERGLCDDLVRGFFTFVHPVFPILHHPAFEATYSALWQKESTRYFNHMADKTVFYATLNIMFALGCMFSDRVDQASRVKVADRFYQRPELSCPWAHWISSASSSCSCFS